MLRSIWKLIKILVVFLIIFGVVSMIVSLIVTFTLSSKMATKMSKLFCSDQTSGQQLNLLAVNNDNPENIAPGTMVLGAFLEHQNSR